MASREKMGYGARRCDMMKSPARAATVPPGSCEGEHVMTEQPFIPGLRLSEVLFEEAVRPILAEVFPGLRYTAALIGPGSEVLGYDTPRSTDHNWGPRLLLFVAAEEHATVAPAMARSASSSREPSSSRWSE